MSSAMECVGWQLMVNGLERILPIFIVHGLGFKLDHDSRACGKSVEMFRFVANRVDFPALPPSKINHKLK